MVKNPTSQSNCDRLILKISLKKKIRLAVESFFKAPFNLHSFVLLILPFLHSFYRFPSSFYSFGLSLSLPVVYDIYPSPSHYVLEFFDEWQILISKRTKISIFSFKMYSSRYANAIISTMSARHM